MGRKQTDHLWCNHCELGTGPVDNDLDDDDDDTEAPPGWVRIIATKVVLNPDRLTQMAERKQFIKSFVEDQLSLLKQGGTSIPPEALATMHKTVNAQAKQVAPDVTEPEHRLLVSDDGYLCPEHAKMLLALDVSFDEVIDE